MKIAKLWLAVVLMLGAQGMVFGAAKTPDELGKELCKKLAELRSNPDYVTMTGDKGMPVFLAFLATVPAESLFKKYTCRFGFVEYKNCTPLAFSMALSFGEDVQKALLEAGKGGIPDLSYQEFDGLDADAKWESEKATSQFKSVRDLLNKHASVGGPSMPIVIRTSLKKLKKTLNALKAKLAMLAGVLQVLVP
ncbi:hypothetical protein K2X40_00230 [Candidatus Babeliales bacterium]|nr:hypothetical protein [Candidatus Babeliales bacterium]